MQKQRTFAGRLCDEQTQRDCAASDQPEQPRRGPRTIEWMIYRRARRSSGHRSFYRADPHSDAACVRSRNGRISNRCLGATDAERLGKSTNYGQVVDTILTESTFSVPAVADVAPPAAPDAGRCSSSVPVISTLCPTCGVSVVSVPSSRYDAFAEAAAPAPLPDVATGEPAPAAEALVSMNGMVGAPVTAAALAG